MLVLGGLWLFWRGSFRCNQELDYWQPEAAYIEQGRELLSLIQMYIKQSTALRNKLHALDSRGVCKGKLVTSIKRQLRCMKKEQHILEEEVERIIKENELSLFPRLRTIPGIGKRLQFYLCLIRVISKDFQAINSFHPF